MRCCGTELQDLLSPALFKALAEPTRLAMLVQLCSSEGECTVSEVASCCDVDLSVVSRHLKTLREAGVLSSRKEGKQVRYSVQRAELAVLFRRLADALDPA